MSAHTQFCTHNPYSCSKHDCHTLTPMCVLTLTSASACRRLHTYRPVVSGTVTCFLRVCVCVCVHSSKCSVKATQTPLISPQYLQAQRDTPRAHADARWRQASETQRCSPQPCRARQGPRPAPPRRAARTAALPARAAASRLMRPGSKRLAHRACECSSTPPGLRCLHATWLMARHLKTALALHAVT